MKLAQAALGALAALCVAGCGASAPRPETTIAGAVSALYGRVGELEEARADIVRARQRNLEALRQNTERTRTETAVLLGAWRLAGHDERLALYQGILAAARGETTAAPDLATRRIPIPVPDTSTSPPVASAQVADALASPSTSLQAPHADRARLAMSAESLALLGAQRSPFQQVFAYVQYLQAVRLEIARIEERAKSAAKEAAAGTTITGNVGASR